MSIDKCKKVKIGLVFTLDYEIHGNGSGDFETWAHFPTSKMLDLFDVLGAKLTIMAEMGHYFAMTKYKEVFSEEIILFESQLKNAIERGHDVQLHFHPQWIDAKFENGTWQLDFSRNTIERFCHSYDDAYVYLKKGKDELQKIIRTVKPDYQCVCFRSGFFQMQPSDSILKALDDAGFVSDSSVAKGIRANDNLRVLDYSLAYSSYLPWKLSQTDICKIDESGKIIEFPILTCPKGLIYKITGRLFRKSNTITISNIIGGFMSKNVRMLQIGNRRSFSDKMKSMIRKKWVIADFCRSDHKDLIRMLKTVISDCKKNNNFDYTPITLIGHSKDLFFSNNLTIFLEACQKIDEIEFSTYYEAVNKYSIGK